MVSNNRWRLVSKLEDIYYCNKAFCAVWVTSGIYVKNRSTHLPKGRLMFIPLENLKQFATQHKGQFELLDNIPFGIFRCKRCGKEYYAPTESAFNKIMICECSKCGAVGEENWEMVYQRDNINKIVGV